VQQEFTKECSTSDCEDTPTEGQEPEEISEDMSSKKLVLTDNTKVMLKMVGFEEQKTLSAKRKKCTSSISYSSSSSASSTSSSSSSSPASSISKMNINRFKAADAHIRKKYDVTEIPHDVLKIIKATAAVSTIMNTVIYFRNMFSWSLNILSQLPEKSIHLVDETVQVSNLEMC
jgi:hypothetical protein